MDNVHLILDDPTTGIPIIEENEKSSVETVQILQHSNITSIHEDAFSSCTSLRSVYIEDGSTISIIGDRAFHCCKSLRGFDIPLDVTILRRQAFFNCISLMSIEIPSNVKTIGWKAFAGCSFLKSVVIKNGVTRIDSRAFCNCFRLQLIEIPDSAVSVSETAFYDCTTLLTAQANCPNFHPNVIAWLRQRFNDLPIHRACYHANNTQESLNVLSSLIEQDARTLSVSDCMAMTPLHILCFKPTLTVAIIRVVGEGDYSVMTQTDLWGNTPLTAFWNARNFYEYQYDNRSRQEIISCLHYLLEVSSQVHNTSLVSYMTAATMPIFRLDVVFQLAMNANLGRIF